MDIKILEGYAQQMLPLQLFKCRQVRPDVLAGDADPFEIFHLHFDP
jgi:hypothetical protein